MIEANLMDVMWQWSPVVAEQEGDHLDPVLIQDMMVYVQSFPIRQQLYQRIQSQEVPWIAEVLEQHHLPASGELTPQSLWTAEFLARHLRALALSLLTAQTEPLLHELQWGDLETSLDLGSLLADLVAVMRRHCSPAEQEIAQPFWDLIFHPMPTAPEPEVGIPEVPTLMEMFV